MSDPFALFITWTCYGTWLPGDSRGHVSNTLLEGGGWLPKEDTPGTPYAEGDEHTRRHAKELQNWPTVWLTPEQALIEAESLVEVARDRGWWIIRAAVMANHLHVLLRDCPDDGPAVRRILKGAGQAKLSERTGLRWRWWTAGGSDRYLHGDDAIRAVDRYIANQQRMLAEIVDMEVRSSGAVSGGV